MAQVIKQAGRQEPTSAILNITGAATITAAMAGQAGAILVPADSGVAIAVIDLPIGAVVTGGSLVTDTPFNAGLTDVLSIGDAGNATRYANGANIHAAGKVDLTTTGYEHTAADNQLKITWTGATPASLTTGAARIILTYVVKGVADFSQG